MNGAPVAKGGAARASVLIRIVKLMRMLKLARVFKASRVMQRVLMDIVMVRGTCWHGLSHRAQAPAGAERIRASSILLCS